MHTRMNSLRRWAREGATEFIAGKHEHTCVQASGRHPTSPFVLGGVSLSLELLNSVRLANSEL